MAERVRATRPRSTGSAEQRSALHGSSADGRAEFSNQAFQRLLRAGHAQTKLAVSTPGDAHEREADAIASRVMSMSAPAVPAAAAVSSSASSASLGRREEDKKHKEDRPAGIRAEEEKREREPDEDGTLQRKAAPAASGVAGDADAAVTAVRGQGQPLPTSEREFLEPRLGRDLANVRVQVGPQAAASAASVGAQAYTVRDNVVFGSGRYAPGTGQGRYLLAHELAHVIQQSPDRVPPLPGGQETVGVGAGGGPEGLSRQADGDDAATVPGAPGASTGVDTAAGPAPEVAQTELGEPTDEVELDAAPTFVPSGAVAEFLAGRRSGGPVHVRYGDVASGLLTVRERRGRYQTFGDRLQAIPLFHPGLQPLRAAGVEPVLAVRIDDSEVSGFVSLRRGANVLRNPSELTDWIRRHPAEMGWAGLSDLRVPEFVNRLEAGSLILRVNDLGFRLGGFMRGTASVGLVGDALTFDGSATVAVGGLSEVQLEVHRDETGQLGGRVEVPVTIANFSGNLLAVFSGGVVDITGQARYETEKLTGDVTLLVTDARTARDVALQRLDPSQVVASAEEASAPAVAEGARPGPRALAGWGVLDFAFTEWMTGQAQVIIDNEGHVTVVGEIAPPAEIELFPQRDFIRRLFTVELRTLYGVPLVGNVFLFANIGLDAMAKLGPARIYNIAVQGTYSTDPRVLNAFSIAATLNISAFAGLRLRGEGGAGVELLGHDIKAGVGVNALAGVRGYVEATPTIGYRETADPQQGRTGEFYLNGHMELAAQPFLGLGGDLFVELDSPWWSPAPDEKWTWPLGELEYPLPGQFGIGADVDYVLGSDEVPEIEFTEVDFNAERFMTDLMNDHVPRSSQGEQEQPGQWAEQGAGAATTSAQPTVVDSQGAPGAGEVAQGQQPAQAPAATPRPENQQRWLQGIRAVNEFARESEQSPLSEAALEASLGEIRRSYGFTRLSATHVGEDWQVAAAMNPENDNVAVVQGTPPSAGPGSAGGTAHTGDRDDPIPITFYKSLRRYRPIRLNISGDPESPDVQSVWPHERTSVPIFTSGARLDTAEGQVELGVAADNQPENMRDERKKLYKARAGWSEEARRTRAVADFTRVVRDLGYDPATHDTQIDHLHDLQFSGQDRVENLWPLDSAANNAANRVRHQLVPVAGESAPRSVGQLHEKWFFIDRIEG